ncbi:tyrosine-protein phosphatase [Microbacterium gorillae]|uniref:tyrosine-protein phosphatase n=1 Tax=Microbacterium gorillae TaxID=1231063 RepID=UPI00058B5FDA|nr:tyrosine-protein phosphatase [Microbacterium gorillae]
MTPPTLIPGVMNFRDTGGLPAGSATSRPGVLYRSGNLARVTPEGEEAFAALGLRRIVDLRDDEEVVRDPSRAGSVPISRFPLFLGSVASFFQADQSLSGMYRAMIDDAADRVVGAVRAILEVQPVLVHCTVGKDRTGVTVALVLTAAGVDEDAVVADYARTETLLPAERNRQVLARLGALYPEMVHLEELTTRSPAEVMRGFLADVRTRFGSAANFLRSHGMTDEEIAGARDVLIGSDRSTIL